ncbi:MAG: hypothetical protein JWO58_1944 [Chitinophagaceae bacterium]|nr:hypothetical protein [Chitinophagaceae bacterium]
MKHFLYLIALSTCIAGCDNKKHESSTEEHAHGADSTLHTTVNKDSCEGGIYVGHAYAYSNFITDNQAYIVERNIEFIRTLESTEPTEETAERYRALTIQTQQSIDSLEKLCPFNGNTAFKEAGVELFKFYNKAWSEYKGLSEIKDKNERIKNYKVVRSVFNDKYAQTEKSLEEKFYKAHTAFANEHALHVRHTPLHEKLDSLLYINGTKI